ncbi:hypothetical protein IH992_18250, partial [Candidatus Poribacteria bacterium]|nr:hypothetical protein [Candidatus Poribacteria bacterium]
DILDAPEAHIPDFLIELENVGYTSDDSTLLSNLPLNAADTYFCVMENTNFMDYWTRVADRLYKIRHCLTIDGVATALSLYEAAIDPAQLVSAAASSSDITSVVTSLSTTVPHYRFSTMIAQAKNMTSTLSQLGSALLSALEKQDAEELAVLRSTHEQNILSLMTTIKEKAIDEANANQDVLNISLESAGKRYDHYTELIDSGLSAYEITSEALTIEAAVMQDAASVIKALSAPAHLIPTVYGFADGDFNPGDAVNAEAQVLENLAQVLNQGASLAATLGQYDRREQEWTLQQALADYDKQQITQQIALGDHVPL